MAARTAAFERDVRDAMSLAMAVKAVFDASDEVSRGEFATLARGRGVSQLTAELLLTSFPGPGTPATPVLPVG